ncbi:MAG: dTDP-4-dehydrorhamnose reductase [Pseudolabrys sp.]|nr:dTDP-4-dehydrorhamnose reductase [Pseudolabrys sp.]
MSGPILLFGAAGQVGRELTALAQARGVKLRGVTRDIADITATDAVAAAVADAKPCLIVNAAAYTAVDRAEKEPDLAHAVNAVGAENIARAAAGAKVPLVHLSTDYVFDGTKTGPYIETDPLAPLGVYGRSKAEGEELVRKACPNAIILRTAWVYGPYGANFLKTMLRLAASQERLRVVADQHGNPTATADIAEAILTVASALTATPTLTTLTDGITATTNTTAVTTGGTFHVAGTGVTTWHGFAAAIVDHQARWTHKRPPVDAIATADYPTPARRPANSALDSTLFARTFGFRAKPWPERMRETIDILLGGPAARGTPEGAP